MGAASLVRGARPSSSTTPFRASASNGCVSGAAATSMRVDSSVCSAASPDRVEPRCPHFGVCGGCALQHLSPAKQLEFKQRQLTEALTRIGRVTPDEILPPLQAGVWNYRRRARLAARWVPRKQRTVVGFRERNTPYIADLKSCDVLQPPVDKLIEPLSVLASALTIRNRLPQIEVAIADNAIALVVRILEELTPADRILLEQFGRDHRVQVFLHARRLRNSCAACGRGDGRWSIGSPPST